VLPLLGLVVVGSALPKSENPSKLANLWVARLFIFFRRPGGFVKEGVRYGMRKEEISFQYRVLCLPGKKRVWKKTNSALFFFTKTFFPQNSFAGPERINLL
jgi:hypothetical protein